MRKQEHVEVLVEQRNEALDDVRLHGIGIVAEETIGWVADLTVVDDAVAEREHARTERDVQRGMVGADPPEGQDPHAGRELVA